MFWSKQATTSKQDLFKLIQASKFSLLTMLKSVENARDVLDLLQKTKRISTPIIKGAKS